MKFSIWTQYGALNSAPVFQSIKTGLLNLGHTISENRLDSDVAVIWSVLWHGRMKGNYEVYNHYKQQNKPVIIIEVGSLIRNHTWKLSLDNVNALGYFGNLDHKLPNRQRNLGIKLAPYNFNRKSEILITTQRPESLQWSEQPSIEEWIEQTITKIKKFTDRKIIVRPHPRYRLKAPLIHVEIDKPKKILDSYDDFNLNFNYHCIVCHNSSIATQSLINGCPIICDQSSLAYTLSNRFEDIENLKYHDRQEWFDKILHTEWTVAEIESGLPFLRLIPEIQKRIS